MRIWTSFLIRLSSTTRGINREWPWVSLPSSISKYSRTYVSSTCISSLRSKAALLTIWKAAWTCLVLGLLGQKRLLWMPHHRWSWIGISLNRCPSTTIPSPYLLFPPTSLRCWTHCPWHLSTSFSHWRQFSSWHPWHLWSQWNQWHPFRWNKPYHQMTQVTLSHLHLNLRLLKCQK